MKWFEYKTEVDALHAPDELKDRLRAMQTEANRPAAKKTVVFPGWRKLSGMAACFMGGAVTVMLAGGVLFMGTMRMGSAAPNDAMMNQSSAGTTAGGGSYGYNGGYGYADEKESVRAEAADDVIMDSNGTVNGVNDPAQPVGSNREGKTAVTGRKIIYTAAMELESTEYDSTVNGLLTQLDEMGGYVQHSESRNQGTNYRWSQYVLRIPVENYQSFMSAAAGCGSLIGKVEDSQDVTATYVDLTARIDTLIQQRTRLQQLSAQAGSLSELLEIEAQLSEVQYQLESYQRQLAALADQVDYCTVTVTVQEVTVYTPVQPTAMEQITRALTRGFEDFGESLFDFLLWILRNLSWLAVVSIGFVVGRKVWKKRRSRRV